MPPVFFNPSHNFFVLVRIFCEFLLRFRAQLFSSVDGVCCCAAPPRPSRRQEEGTRAYPPFFGPRACRSDCSSLVGKPGTDEMRVTRG